MITEHDMDTIQTLFRWGQTNVVNRVQGLIITSNEERRINMLASTIAFIFVEAFDHYGLDFVVDLHLQWSDRGIDAYPDAMPPITVETFSDQQRGFIGAKNMNRFQLSSFQKDIQLVFRFVGRRIPQGLIEQQSLRFRRTKFKNDFPNLSDMGKRIESKIFCFARASWNSSSVATLIV